MERLTKPAVRHNGNKYVSAIGSGYGVWPRIIQRLAAYEDTGLTPEEVEATVRQLNTIVERYGLYHDGRGDAILELLTACKEGRLVILPAVPEKDRQSFIDGLHDYFFEAKTHDPSVGIFGMTDEEARLADALMEALNGSTEAEL